MPETPTTSLDEDSAPPPPHGAAEPSAPHPCRRALRRTPSGRSLILLLAIGIIAVAAAFGWQSKLADGLARDPAAEDGWGTWGFGGQSPELVEQPAERLSDPFAFSPDGTLLASAGSHDVTLWDVRTGHISTSLDDQSMGFACSLAFSPNGASLAMAGDNGIVVIWDLAARSRRVSLPTSPESIRTSAVQVAWHPTGRWVATCQGVWYDEVLHPHNGKTTVWDARTGVVVKSLPACPGECSAMAFSPDGRMLATGSTQGLAVWDWQNPGRASDCGLHEAVDQVTFSQDGRWLGVGHARPLSRDGSFASHSITLFDTSTFSRGKTFPSGSPCFAFAGADQAIVLTDNGGRLWEHRIESSEKSRRAPGLAGVDVFTIAPTGTTLVAAGLTVLHRKPVVYNLVTGEIVPSFRGPQEGILDLQFLGTRRLAVRGYRATVLLDLAHDAPFWRRTGADDMGATWQSLPSSDGRYLASLGATGLRVVEVESGRSIATFPMGDKRWISAFQWIPGQHDMLVTDTDNPVLLAPGNTRTVRWEPLASKVTSFPLPVSDPVAIHPRRARVVARTSPTTWQVLDVASGCPLVTMPGQTAVKLSPDGRWLVGGNERGRIQVWDGHTGRFGAAVLGHRDPIAGLSFSADGRFLASSDRQATRVWDVHRLASPPHERLPGAPDELNEGALLATLPAAAPVGAGVHVIQRFSPDGRTLLVHWQDGAFQVWDVPTGARLGTLSFQYGGTRWFFLAADGRYDGSEDILPRIDVRVQGQVYPLTSFDRGHYSPGLLASIFDGQRPSMPSRLRALPCPSPPPAVDGPGTSPRE